MALGTDSKYVPQTATEFLQLTLFIFILQRTANEERVSCIRALLSEQRDISLNAAAHSLSAIHLRQRLYVYQRYFVALTRFRKPDTALENARKSPDALVELTTFQVCEHSTFVRF